MRILIALVVVSALGVAPAAADALADARRLYNLGQYDMAARNARDALKLPATAESARIVLGRIYLEQYRRTADSADLIEAREALRAVNPEGLSPRERTELQVGLGEAFFLENRFGPASELFERALDSSSDLGPAAHERVLDWWASSLDRLALDLPRDARLTVYLRVLERMEKEFARDSSSPPASYWLAAAARGTGNLESRLPRGDGGVGHGDAGAGPRRGAARRP
jgi:tetratricopeptide (TPR) repeat protein